MESQVRILLSNALAEEATPQLVDELSAHRALQTLVEAGLVVERHGRIEPTSAARLADVCLSW